MQVQRLRVLQLSNTKNLSVYRRTELSKMKTTDFTSWVTTPHAIEKAMEFAIANGLPFECHEQFRWLLVCISNASATDLQNATGNFIRRFSDQMYDDLNK